mmetsp:Transcript_175/g.239  ORF Transcript_175/g.239 Transcript_175/m.239 type:complete len:104 (+) Transcript_175:868-1179(+)
MYCIVMYCKHVNNCQTAQLFARRDNGGNKLPKVKAVTSLLVQGPLLFFLSKDFEEEVSTFLSSRANFGSSSTFKITTSVPELRFTAGKILPSSNTVFSHLIDP